MRRGRLKRSTWVWGWMLATGCTALREGPLSPDAGDRDAVVSDGTEAVDRLDVSDSGSPTADRTGAVDAADAMVSCPEDMVLIAGGTFQMGAVGLGMEPVHAVRLSAYCLDRTEVTVAAYRSCTTCMSSGTGAACNAGVAGRDRHPMNCLRWSEAEAYCESLGRRLPTEAEWEYAARGTTGRRYPWGDANLSTQACWNRSSTCPVGTFPSGATPLGVLDLAGNVAEWVSDFHRNPYPTDGSLQVDPRGPISGTEKVTRGGSWQLSDSRFAYTFQGSDRRSAPPATADAALGFRCAR